MATRQRCTGLFNNEFTTKAHNCCHKIECQVFLTLVQRLVIHLISFKTEAPVMGDRLKDE